jgi:hypothetical protein
LYERVWEGQWLRDDEFVVSADEKTSILAGRGFTHPASPTGFAVKVEHEYERCGAWAYLAALDVHHFRLFGRYEPATGIVLFDQLVAQVMTQPPY